MEEFSKLIPFVLAFIPKISRVEIIDNVKENHTIFVKKKQIRSGLILPISKIQNCEETDILILHASNERVAIATEVEESVRGYLVKNIKYLPKLFCDFPLVGTESFHFPVIINSFFFNPQTERDGIWLKGSDDIEVEENRRLLENAVELYRNLFSQVIDGDFFDLYNLAEAKMPATNDKYFDENWYKDIILKPIREFIYKSKIVELEDEDSEKKAIEELCFPIGAFTEGVKDRIWQFTFDLYPNLVCKRKHLNSWCDLFWEDWRKINYQFLVDSLVKLESIHELSQALRKTNDETFNWLNSLGDFILKDDSNLALVEKNAIIPNKNGIFKKKIDLYTDEIKDDDLIVILELLGEVWGNILCHDTINFGVYGIKNKKDIAVKITEKLIKKPVKDNNLVKAISLLSEWFENNPTLGKDLFTELYGKRAELFMNTIEDKESLYKVMRTCTDLSKLAEVAKAIEDNPKIIESIQRGEELVKLLLEFKVNDVSDLKKMLISSMNSTNDSKIQITQETLLSLGITSIEELEEILRDKNISDQFIHSSTPTLQMFLYVQNLIKRSKNNVLEYLKTLPNYDCSEWEELANTIIGGIKKDDLSIPIYIVVRPSDNREVIVYYSSEKDTLDDPSAELWIDNGVDDPRHLTLGKVLKTTGINRIPV